MASNLPLLEEAAAKLKHLLPEVVFVGGSTLDLIVTDQGSARIRSTYDVDVIVAADYAITRPSVIDCEILASRTTHVRELRFVVFSMAT